LYIIFLNLFIYYFRYAQEMLTKKHAFNQATVEKMTDDISAVRELFVKHVKPAYFDAQIKALEDLKELLDSYFSPLPLFSSLPFVKHLKPAYFAVQGTRNSCLIRTSLASPLSHLSPFTNPKTEKPT
jgi:hypothetical protein